MTFEDALTLGSAIQEHGAGQRIRRMTLFDKMEKSPTSGTSRALITESNRYGITTGSYAEEYLTLTSLGAAATNPDVSPRERFRARFQLAIENVPVFKSLFEALVGNKIPAREVLRDQAGEHGIAEEERAPCVDLFLTNSKFVGVLKVLSGAERLISVDLALDELPKTESRARPEQSQPTAQQPGAKEPTDFRTIAFFIAPIGEE